MKADCPISHFNLKRDEFAAACVVDMNHILRRSHSRPLLRATFIIQTEFQNAFEYLRHACSDDFFGLVIDTVPQAVNRIKQGLHQWRFKVKRRVQIVQIPAA